MYRTAYLKYVDNQFTHACICHIKIRGRRGHDQLVVACEIIAYHP